MRRRVGRDGEALIVPVYADGARSVYTLMLMKVAVET